MSFGRLTVDLWRRAPAWRFLVIGAVVVSVVAVVSKGPAGNGGTGGGTTTAGTTVGGTTGSTSAGATGGGNSTSPAPQACGPVIQPSKQSPIVVSGTGQAPKNVSMSGGSSASGGMGASTQARIQQFVFEVDAAASDGREGESCIRMVGALGRLESLDYAYANCFVNGEDKFKRAKGCEADVKASVTRFERLLAAFSALRKDGSATYVEKLADAWSNMRSFDKTTEQWTQIGDVTSLAEQAVADIKRSEDRISSMENAAATVKSTENAETLKALSAAGQLTALDRARLNDAQRELLEQAVDAKKTLTESDQRFRALEVAVSGNSSTDSDARGALIDSVSRLEPFDLLRATPEQSESIQKANTAAAAYAMEDLLQSSLSFNSDTAIPAAFVRLRDLRALVLKYGGDDAPGPEVTAALDTAKHAENALLQSDGRIRSMKELVLVLREGGPAEFGESVIDAHAAIKSFDIARFSDNEKRLYAELGAAREVSVATGTGQVTRSVPIFLRAPDTNASMQQAEREFREGMISAGFNLVNAEEQSAISLVLSIGDVELKELDFSGSTIRTAEVSLMLRGGWTIVDRNLDFPLAEGEAIRGQSESLGRRAISDAVSQLLDSVKMVADSHTK